MSSTRAQWVTGIPDLYDEDRLTDAGEYFTANRVSQETGLAPSTIKGALSRPVVTSDTNPLGPLSRPAARIGTKPLYSHEQTGEAKARREALSGRRHFGGQDQPLTTITFEEARRCGFESAAEIAASLDLHEQTIRAWRAATGDAFPPPVGMRERPPEQPKGAPSVVFERKAMMEWMLANGKITEIPKTS
jgi:hypothetical protein